MVSGGRMDREEASEREAWYMDQDEVEVGLEWRDPGVVVEVVDLDRMDLNEEVVVELSSHCK